MSRPDLMPQTLNFDQIATSLLERLREARKVDGAIDHEAMALVNGLRLVWNARGAADIAALDIWLAWAQGTLTSAGPSVKNLERALRSLDR